MARAQRRHTVASSAVSFSVFHFHCNTVFVPVLPRPAWQCTATLPSFTAKAKTFTISIIPARVHTPKSGVPKL